MRLHPFHAWMRMERAALRLAHATSTARVRSEDDLRIAQHGDAALNAAALACRLDAQATRIIG